MWTSCMSCRKTRLLPPAVVRPSSKVCSLMTPKPRFSRSGTRRESVTGRSGWKIFSESSQADSPAER